MVGVYMKMPHVIADLIRNPGRHYGEGRKKDWMPAYAGMTMDFHMKPQDYHFQNLFDKG